eukprot:678698-Pleurochrysis_carterae.AAC.2
MFVACARFTVCAADSKHFDASNAPLRLVAARRAAFWSCHATPFSRATASTTRIAAACRRSDFRPPAASAHAASVSVRCRRWRRVRRAAPARKR